MEGRVHGERLPAVVVLGVILWTRLRRGGLKATHAAAAVRFFLKASSLAPAITTFVEGVASLLSRLDL